MESKNVKIATFVNPHLFWITESNSESDLINLMRELKNGPVNTESCFVEGDIVAVKYHDSVFRAIIEKVYDGKITNYLCWLIDYAVLIESLEVYKLTANLRKIPPFAKQASLNNLVYLKEILDYNGYESVIQKTPSISMNNHVRQKIMDILSQYPSVEFILKEKYNGIMFGDLKMMNDKKTEFLSELLQQAELMQSNPTLFNKIKENLHTYKDSQLMLIGQITTNFKIEGEVFLQKVNIAEFAERHSTESYRSQSKRSSDSDKSMNVSEDSLGETSVQESVLESSIGEISALESALDSCSSSTKSSSVTVPLIPAGYNLTYWNSKNSKSKKLSALRKKATILPTEVKDATFTPLVKTNPPKSNKIPENSKCLNTSENLQTNIITEDPCVSKTHLKKVVEKELIHTENKPCIKPSCTCLSCNHYSNDTTLSTINIKETVELEMFKPEPLFKNNSIQEETRQMHSIKYSSMSKIERQIASKILIHGLSIPTPLKYVASACFHKKVHEVLQKLNYTECKRMQSYTWPAMLRQHNVFIINKKNSGCTMAYLPVICSLVLEKERYRQLSNFEGPIVIILCSNSKHCEDVYDLTRKLLNWKSRIVHATYPRIYDYLPNNDVLVTTPTILLDLLKNNYVNFKRLCNLVIENAEIIFKRDASTMDKIFKVVDDMLSHRVCPKSVQIIVVAKHWNNNFKPFIKKLSKVPFICIGNYLEAARYGNVHFSLKLLNSACKELELKSLLKDSFNIYKSIVICNENDLEEIETTFALKGIEGIIIKDSHSKEDILYAEEQWNNAQPGHYKVLVCTDIVLNSELTITNATFLIHYSLPSSWTKFTKRYSCFLESIKPILETEDKTILKSVVLSDEVALKKQMPKFLKYFSTLNIDLPPTLLEWEKGIRLEEETFKVGKMVPLCPHIRLFGTSCNDNACNFRHILDKTLDGSDTMSKNGKIKFKIVNVVDTTHFCVIPLEQEDLKGETVYFSDCTEITEKLTMALKDNKIPFDDTMDKMFYAYMDKDQFYRCEILLNKTDDTVQIKLLDTGKIVDVLKNKLYQLPDDFYNMPSAIHDMYLANCVPPYGDETFSAKSYRFVVKMITELEVTKLTLTADIHLQLGNILWVKNVVEEKHLGNDIQVYPFQLTKRLIQSKLVTTNKTQLENLYKICQEADIELPIYEIPKLTIIPKLKQVKAQWAFLDKDSVESVTFCAGISPEEFYVRMNKFRKQLNNLQKEIQAVARRRNQDMVVEEGKYYLAKDQETDDYGRVIVMKKDGNSVLCYFVDFGDEIVLDTSELKFLPNEYIIKLPCQAIQCSLHGINNPLNDWQDEAVNILYEYSLEPNSDVFRTLYVKSCGKLSSMLDKQNRYSVLLKDGFGEKKILINKLMVDCGLACLNGEVLDDFEIIADEEATETDDEEAEALREICAKTEEIYRKTEDGIDDGSEMELFINNAENFFNEFLNSRSTAETSNRSKPDLPKIQAAPSVDYLTPEVYWSQTTDTVKMNIRVTDCQECTITLKKSRIFKFNTMKDRKEYKLNLIFFDKLDSFEYTLLGPQVRVTMIKSKNQTWPRLLISKEKCRNIHYDISCIEDEEDEVQKRILTLPPEFQDSTDDDDEDNDDLPVYTVYTDEDSEFGEELGDSD